MPAEYAPVIDWFTRKRTKPEDEWCREAISHAREILGELGIDIGKNSRETVRYLVSLLVQIRNKTKAHGALGPDFYNANNTLYISAIDALINQCPLFQWQWYHISHRLGKDPIRGVHLLGTSPAHITKAEASRLTAEKEGVYIEAPSTGKLFSLGKLLGSTRECREFSIPNGNFRDTDSHGEVIDYATGAARHFDFSLFGNVPAPLPSSETEGLFLTTML
jgi:hypothetical protein